MVPVDGIDAHNQHVGRGKFAGSQFGGRSLISYNSSGVHQSRRVLEGGGVDFSEQLPSTQWAGLTFRGERIAEVWFKPEGGPLTLVFRIPQSSFQASGIAQRLTVEHLLKAVGIAIDEVESCRQGGASHSDAELTDPLSPPLGVSHLEIRVWMKAPPAEVGEVSVEAGVVPAKWHELEARWKAVLGLEASVDSVRKSLEGLRAELEAAMRGVLAAEEKVHALAADVAVWNKAKSRAHYALPKASEFIHRATWATGTPERKRLSELFKKPIGTQTSLPSADEVREELEVLRKDRQIFSAQGVAVYQECKGILADVQSALRRLQGNAAARAKEKGGRGRIK